MLAKSDVMQAMAQMPEQMTYEQVITAIDELQFIEDVKRGLDNAKNQQTYSIEDVFRELGLP